MSCIGLSVCIVACENDSRAKVRQIGTLGIVGGRQANVELTVASQANCKAEGSTSCHAGSDDRLLRPRPCPSRRLEPLEPRSGADRHTGGSGACGFAWPFVQRPSRLGGDRSAGGRFHLAALRSLFGAVLGSGLPPCPADRLGRAPA